MTRRYDAADIVNPLWNLSTVADANTDNGQLIVDVSEFAFPQAGQGPDCLQR